jgi:hypothetical protein
LDRQLRKLPQDDLDEALPIHRGGMTALHRHSTMIVIVENNYARHGTGRSIGQYWWPPALYSAANKM